MNSARTRHALLWAIGSTALLSIAIGLPFSPAPPAKPATDQSTPRTATARNLDLAEAFSRLTFRPPLTAEQLAEDARMDEEQVSAAETWLNSPDAERRLAGAEQLAAYPTARAQILLCRALQTDPNPEVRSTAAVSLQRFKTPSDKTMAVVVASLADGDRDVRSAVLQTLDVFMSHEASGSHQHAKLRRQLRSKRQNARLDRETRKAVVALLNKHS